VRVHGHRRLAAETALAALVLMVLALVVFWPHLHHGGLYWDDWQLAARARFPPVTGYAFGLFDLGLAAFRPVLALVLPLPQKVIGLHPGPQLVLALVLGVAAAAGLFAVLREAGVGRAPALAAGALVLIFPWSDSMNLWGTAALNWLGVVFFEAGAIAAMRSLGAEPPRAARLRAAALVAFVLSILTYEIAAAATLVFLAVLYAVRLPGRDAVRRLALDAIPVVGATAWVGLNTARRIEGASGIGRHAGTVARDAANLAARALWPWGLPPSVLVLTGAAAILAVGWWLARSGDRVARQALAVAGAGALGVIASYVLLVPADAHYRPLAPGLENRTNLLAALAYALLVAGVCGVLGALAARTVRRPAAAAAVAGALLLAIGLGDIHRTRRDARAWDRASTEQHVILDAVRAAVPRPVPRAVIFTEGVRAYVRPGIPVFAVSWDEKGAARLLFDRRDVRAFPVAPTRRLVCGPAGVHLSRPSAYGAYGRVYRVDVPTRHATLLRSRAACEASG
jgi:hypothetical protein